MQKKKMVILPSKSGGIKKTRKKITTFCSAKVEDEEKNEENGSHPVSKISADDRGRSPHFQRRYKYI